MKLSTLMVIKAIIVIIFGIGFVVIPAPILSLYGASLDPVGILMTRLFGAAFILLAVMLWQAKSDPGSPALKAIVLGVFSGDTIGFVVALLGQLSGLFNALGWLNVVLYFLLALGFGYFSFKK